MLGSSLLFYASWNYRYVPLLLLHILVDWGCGRAIGSTSSRSRKRAFLIASITFNLSSLALFKFYPLIRSTLLDANVHLPALSLALPLGISFFAFESLSYTIDVYRGAIRPFASPLKLGVFVTWFPHLVAGPIVRPSQIAEQLDGDLAVTREGFYSGTMLMLSGYAKKLLIADWLGRLADPYFQNPSAYSSWELLLAVYAYAFQIYCDFSAYTDIARGCSRWFGVELPENFDHPYDSATITEFWRRWHMSLSHWLRDYLYIPLGGNRKGKARTYANLMMTMLLGGLWHGASWTFMLWGGLHGLYLAAERALGVSSAKTRAGLLAQRVLTFNLVCFAWIFFRASTFRTAIEYVRGIVALNFRFDPAAMSAGLGIVGLIAAYHVARIAKERLGLLDLSPDRRFTFVTLASAALALFAVLGASSQTFIYFQF